MISDDRTDFKPFFRTVESPETICREAKVTFFLSKKIIIGRGAYFLTTNVFTF